jgi:hypothetical protein
MLKTSRTVIILSLSLMSFVSVTALADDPVTIRIYNDDTDDIVLNVYDMNAQPPKAVVVNQRINGVAGIPPISVLAGAVGRGHVKWTARSVDPGFARCGYREMREVENDTSVYVSLNSSCRNITR